MIFCSRRVYLNILTQMMDLDTLLNANYFLVDQIKPTGYATIDDYGSSLPMLNTEGEISQGLSFPQQSSDMHGYFVKYSTVLDPTPFYATAAASSKTDYSTPLEKFINYLSMTETHINIYQQFFNIELQGNGLQVLIMRSDYGCQMFGDVICSYLAEIFGADVTFVDPKYRPKTKGRLQYVGNKAYATQHINELRDIQLKNSIQLMVDTVQYGDGMNNLMQFLNNTDMTIEKLIYVHNIIFPNAPLPPGNYTKDHIIQIITGQIMNSVGGNSRTSMMRDLFGSDNGSFFSLVNSYKNATEEESFDGVS